MKGEIKTLNKNLRSFLESEAERLSEPVKQFANITLVYEGKRDKEFEGKCNWSYGNAKDAATEWLQQVLLMETMVTRCEIVQINLSFLDDSFDILVQSNMSSRHFGSSGMGFCEGTLDRTKKDLILTPIGLLTPYVYEAITEIKGNPVELFYRHLSKQAGILHDKCGSGVLTAELLSKHNMRDVLEVYKMDLLLRDMDKFFEGK